MYIPIEALIVGFIVFCAITSLVGILGYRWGRQDESDGYTDAMRELAAYHD